MNYKLKYNLPHDPTTCLGWLLDARGVEDPEAYVYPSKENELNPWLLDNIDEAAQLLIWHLQAGDEVLFIVDSDADGFTSSAMLWNYIKEIRPDAKLSYIMHEHKGHGLDDLIDRVLESSAKLVILADAGSNDYVQHKQLKDAGKESICLDHHVVDHGYSKNSIVVNNQLSSNYSNKWLCGAGVVYKFLFVLDKYFQVHNAEKYMDLCAVGNIADMMSPSNAETRYYTVEGLKHINNGGLKALLNAQSFSLYRNSQGLNYTKIAFYIAPIINAVIRIGTMEEKKLLFEAFINPDELVQSDKRGAKAGDMETLATQAARKAINARARQNRVKDKATDLIDFRIQKEGLLDNKIIVVEIYEEDNIPQELTGLLATQFVNKYQRPCIIVRKNPQGFLRGSIRGNDSFEEVPDLKDFLESSGFTEYVQGHKNAAGISIHEKQLESLINYANFNISDKGLESCYYVDYIFKANENFSQLALTIADNEDLWGNDISEPHVVVEDILLSSSQLFIMGENKDSVKWTLNGVEYVKFKDADFVDTLQQYGLFNITVYGKFAKNVWQGKTSPQLIIEDFNIKDASDEF